MITASSVGNDIVWLDDPVNVGRHVDLRLVRRILTHDEQVFVKTATEPDRMLWALWAAKEAAYKAWTQAHPGAAFSPVSFVVDSKFSGGETLNQAQVVHENQSVPVVWTHGPDWVHAVVGTDPSGIVSTVETATGNQSIAVRTLAERALVEAGYPPGGIEGRPPRYIVDGQGIPISLSHDGPYLAVAFRCLRWTKNLQP